MLLFYTKNTHKITNLGGIQEQINVMDYALREIENCKENIFKNQ